MCLSVMWFDISNVVVAKMTRFRFIWNIASSTATQNIWKQYNIRPLQSRSVFNWIFLDLFLEWRIKQMWCNGRVSGILVSFIRNYIGILRTVLISFQQNYFNVSFRFLFKFKRLSSCGMAGLEKSTTLVFIFTCGYFAVFQLSQRFSERLNSGMLQHQSCFDRY